MMDESLVNSKENCRQVLSFWHKLEFFMPYDLDDELSYNQAPIIDVAFPSLQSELGNKLLPWLSSNRGLCRYVLYLFPFDKKELTRLSTRFFPLEFSNICPIELEETLDEVCC